MGAIATISVGRTSSDLDDVGKLKPSLPVQTVGSSKVLEASRPNTSSYSVAHSVPVVTRLIHPEIIRSVTFSPSRRYRYRPGCVYTDRYMYYLLVTNFVDTRNEDKQPTNAKP